MLSIILEVGRWWRWWRRWWGQWWEILESVSSESPHCWVHRNIALDHGGDGDDEADDAADGKEILCLVSPIDRSPIAGHRRKGFDQ
jgi:hypothetical protein